MHSMQYNEMKVKQCMQCNVMYGERNEMNVKQCMQ